MKRYLFAVGLICSTAWASVPDQIEALGESDKLTIFKKLLVAEDSRCSKISRVFFRGKDSTGAGFWGVQCSGKAYQVMVKNNAGGSSTILDCDVAKAVGMNCFAPFR